MFSNQALFNLKSRFFRGCVYWFCVIEIEYGVASAVVCSTASSSSEEDEDDIAIVK